MRLLVCPAVAQSVKFLWSIAAFTFIVSNSVVALTAVRVSPQFSRFILDRDSIHYEQHVAFFFHMLDYLICGRINIIK